MLLLLKLDAISEGGGIFTSFFLPWPDDSPWSWVEKYRGNYYSLLVLQSKELGNCKYCAERAWKALRKLEKAGREGELVEGIGWRRSRYTRLEIKIKE